MSDHSVAETKNKLSELIDRALEGEDVVITRHGHPVARISPVKPPLMRHIKEAVEWLKAHPPVGKMPKEDAGTTVSRMRDEDWAR
jgi:prevent-host-death family protein